MPLPVGCCCSYLAGDYAGAAGHIFEASKYLKAIKAKKAVNGYAEIPVRGVRRRLTQENRDDALAWFGVQAADILADAGIKPPYTLVPVPSGAAAIGTSIRPRTVLQALAIEREVGNDDVTVADIVRWDEPLKSAHEDGPRFADQLYPHIRFTREPTKGARVVLVDDVLTSGGHFKAIRAALERKGARVVYGLCAARTVHEQVHDSWAIVNLTLEDWTPPTILQRFFGAKPKQ
jgi:hypothetical protein